MNEPTPGMAPLVTVITAVRNGAATIERTLRSVREQTHPRVRHVVVDGQSADGTVEILRRQDPPVVWTSGPDRGLYDAMNKGLDQVEDPASYVLFLNADDAFHAPDTVERAMAAGGGADAVYGRLERWDEEHAYRDVIGREVDSRDLLFGMRCHHQALFVRRRVFDRIGRFDLAYRIAADYDWVVRLFLDGTLTRRYVPVVVSVMNRGGLSDVRYLESVRERRRIVAHRYSRLDWARYRVWSVFGDTLRYRVQRALAPLGLLNAARRVKRAMAARSPAGKA